jgi:DMSO/TMAO reductase YedYZ molybdopterin-dependent catalytic subunit
MIKRSRLVSILSGCGCDDKGVRVRGVVSAVVGLLTAFTGLGVGELAAVFVRPEASPLIAVGNRLITLTPGSVKRSAIESVGADDKPLLLTGIVLVVAVFGLFLGQWAVRDLRAGLAGVSLFAAFGIYCAATADASRGADVIPAIAGAAAAAAVLVVLVRLARRADVADTDGDRRRLLLGGAATAALAALAGFGGRAAQHARFSVASARADVQLPAPAVTEPALPAGVDLGKSGVPWATPNGRFYRIDRALTVPQIDPKDWRLRIHGMVDRPTTLTYDELLARPLVEHWVTLCCVSNEVGGDLVSNALFRGAPLADVLREAGIHPGADQLLMTGAEGTTIGAPTAAALDGRAAMLAVGMNGQPLPLAHGFPVRVVIPGLYGYVSACKWVVDLKATTFASERAFWVQNGWYQQTPIVLMSRIDRPHSGAALTKGTTVAIAGVAWDQHVGVSRVEVQIGEGSWQQARLAAVPSADTWRQWVLPWTPQQAGSYRIRVRAVDARGAAQDETGAPPGPGGATGLHAITVHVTA